MMFITAFCLVCAIIFVHIIQTHDLISHILLGVFGLMISIALMGISTFAIEEEMGH